MQVIADLQIHSRFSRAVSKAMTLPTIADWAKRKGIGLVATGDWTHPLWFREIEKELVESGNGFLQLKTGENKIPFLLATEVSCIYSQNGKGRRVHTLIWVPTLAAARNINKEMTKRGCNLLSDGRPIIGLTSIQVAELVFGIEPNAIIIPAHVWTPWFSVYGNKSGFDTLSEAFGEYAGNIFAVETGLSSNPAMNWRIKELDNRSIVSFSDAHSGPKLGREATVFDLDTLSYTSLYKAIKNQKIAYTIEFYPEEGKYHYTGHRACGVRLHPNETNTICSVCGKSLTIGVMQRVDQLANRTEEDLALYQENGKTYSKTFPNRPPFVMTVPLLEIIAESIGSPVTSNKTQALYMRLTNELGTEFFVLFEANHAEIAKIVGNDVALGVENVRNGTIHIDPGYDGIFGVVKIWNDQKQRIHDPSKKQLTLLDNA